MNFYFAFRWIFSVGKNHLWEFLCQLLRISESVQAKDRVIQWESREEGVFRIIDSKEVASLWGKHKGNEKMTYEKLSRALRYAVTNTFIHVTIPLVVSCLLGLQLGTVVNLLLTFMFPWPSSHLWPSVQSMITVVLHYIAVAYFISWTLFALFILWGFLRLQFGKGTLL